MIAYLLQIIDGTTRDYNKVILSEWGTNHYVDWYEEYDGDVVKLKFIIDESEDLYLRDVLSSLFFQLNINKKPVLLQL